MSTGDLGVDGVVEQGDAPEPDAAEPDAPEADTPEALLRRELLGHLVELWYSQDEVLRLSAQWTRYEELSAKARLSAEEALAAHDGDYATGLTEAQRLLGEIEGLSSDQRRFAISSAVRAHKPPHAERDENGYANTAFVRARERRKDMGLLSSQLITMVADFELFVLRVVSAWLAFDSTPIEGRKREITFREMLELDSVEELRESVVQGFLEDHMRKSATSWFAEFGKFFNGNKIEGAGDFAVLEAFQRRHVLVHHGGLVSRQYLDALSGHKVSVSPGDDLPVDLAYILKAADALACVAHSIVVTALNASIANKPEERQETEKEIGELTYILLTLRRDEVVDRFVTKFDVSRVKRQFSKELLRVNGWIAKRRLGRLAKVKGNVESWDVSASADAFKLAKLVLLDDEEAAVAMAVDMLEQGRLTTYAVASWPLYENMKRKIFAASELLADSADAVADHESAEADAQSLPSEGQAPDGSGD